MDFTPMRVGAEEVFTVDYVDELAPGETILSAAWEMRVVQGVDPSASAMIIGTATVKGSVVSQLITGGVAGVTYRPICWALTSLGQRLDLPEIGNGLLLVGQ